MGFDPVMVQTFDMVLKRGAQKMPPAAGLSNDLTTNTHQSTQMM
jgi:hypothetical protein